MWSIIVFLVIGIFLGSTLNISDRLKEYISKLQYIGVLLLLFTMGVSLGVNKSILKNLNEIGLKALVFAILTSLFSVIAVYLITSRIVRKES